VDRRPDRSEQRPTRPLPWWTALAGAAAVALSITGTLLWLLSIARHNPQLRIEAIKVGLSVGAGMGGAIALLLAFRRQWLNEHVARDTAYDATERRVTELYGQAVEQLGHAKAAVRLGGLYSLERLAQDHRQHRQTVVDVVCAYLRMPFTPPDGSSAAAEAESPPQATQDAQDTQDAHEQGRQELQVRLAAQRLLARHLAVQPAGGKGGSAAAEPGEPPDSYWAGMNIDLTGASLHDFNFVRCRPRRVDFGRARFSGFADFGEAHFIGDAWFRDAHFLGNAWFRDTRFSRDAWFSGVRFSDLTLFRGARFDGDVTFIGARFGGNSAFGKARFCDAAGFDGAWFVGYVEFDGARFEKYVGFEGTRFGGAANFPGVVFGGLARFVEAQFDGPARFEDVQVVRHLDVEGGTARYSDAEHRWPESWHLEAPSDDSDIGRLVSSDDAGSIWSPRTDTDERD
jgi:uncharacterized protein YjbI with pentapeptide repeats